VKRIRRWNGSEFQGEGLGVDLGGMGVLDFGPMEDVGGWPCEGTGVGSDGVEFGQRGRFMGGVMVRLVDCRVRLVSGVGCGCGRLFRAVVAVREMMVGSLA